METVPNIPLYDAHNHLQDERLRPFGPTLVSDALGTGICGMVVNGACESDWADVLELANRYPEVIPSFGYHPWYVREGSDDWQKTLLSYIDRIPSAVGEIGLDRWVKDHDIVQQEEVFRFQLQLAAERNLPASIHCLQAWGRMLELLQTCARPACGFVLHSFGGPKEMVPALAECGAYFSLPGYFAHERKLRQRETFKHVPIERLLIETDAPDQLLPDDLNHYPITESGSGKPLNHPANLRAVYEFGSKLLGIPLEDLARQVESNFLNVFGSLLRRRT